MRFVIDASVAVKWVVSEEGTPEAAALQAAELLAPDLFCADCANILWKKARRGELTADVARLASDVLARTDVQLLAMRNLLPRATRLAIASGLSANDCLYLVLAEAEGCPLVTADEGLVAKVAGSSAAGLPTVLTLAEAAEQLARA